MRSRCYAIFRIHKRSIHFCIISLLNSRRTTGQGVGGVGWGRRRGGLPCTFLKIEVKCPDFAKKSTLILEIFACWTLILYVVHGPQSALIPINLHYRK